MMRRLAVALVLACVPASALPAGEAQDVMTIDEAARFLRVPRETVLAMAIARRLPAQELEGEWRLSRTALLDWLKGRSEPLASVELSGITGQGSPRTHALEQVAQASPAAPASPAPPATVGEKPSAPTAEEVALRDQGALLKGGAKSLELGLAYARAERETFPIARNQARLFAATLTGRYGIKDDLQATVRLPWSYRQNRSYLAIEGSAEPKSASLDDRYFGDLSLSLLGVGMREAMGRPNVVWSVDSVLPTGPGDRGLGASTILSKSYDPLVLFGGLSYMRGFSTDESQSRRLLPKYSLRTTLGYSYAVNDNLALNGSFASTYRSAIRVEPGTVPASRERHQLQLGMTWMLGRGLFVEPAAAIGVGGSAPDVTLSLNVPYTF